MKKALTVVLMCFLIYTLSACSAKGKKVSGSSSTNENFYLQYYPDLRNMSIRGNKGYITGLLCNGSGTYDILSIENASIVLSDPNGRVQKRIKLNSSIANNCSIGRYGSVPYNISFDLSDTNFTSLREVRYSVEGTYRYSKCVGNGCKICNTQKNTATEHTNTKDSPTQILCTWCKGSGVCKECDGSGKNGYSGVLAAYGCQLCDKTGVCAKCGGDGYTDLY